MELENRSAHGGFDWVIDINLVDSSNEPRAEPGPPCVRSEDIANERGRLGRPQLDGGDLLFLASDGDGGAAGGAQVAHPVDLAEGTDDAPPACVLGDRDRRGSRQAGLAA